MESSKNVHLFPMLAVEDLQLTEVESLFHLIQTHDTDWVQLRASFEIPDDCSQIHHIIYLKS